MQRYGWVLLFHDCIVQQLRTLQNAVECAEQRDPDGYTGNANVKLFRALSHAMLEIVPSDPTRDEFRQGNTLGPEYRHWRRVKIGRRFRLFFRFHSRSKTIVFAWVNDQKALRKAGGSNDPYAVFTRMLERGQPPGEWDQLLASCSSHWTVQES